MQISFIARLKKRRSERRRQENFAAIERLGFKPMRISALGQARLYRLVDSEGRIYDNDGQGYPSSLELKEAAEKLVEAKAESSEG